MSKGTEQMIEKAITSLSFGGGIGLSVEESNTFIDYMVDQSFLKNNVRIERMNASKKKIDKIGIGQNILRPGISAVDPGNTVNIATSQIELNTKEVIACVEIGDDSIEDNIETDDVVDHIMKMVAMQAANELEVAYLYGKKLDDGTPTHITQLFDGWVTIAKEKANVVDASSNAFSDRYISREKLSRMLKTMPQQYKTNRTNLRYLCADDIYQDYSDTLSDRLTAVGDPYVQGTAQIRYGNVLMQNVPLMATDNAVLVVGGASDTVSATAVAGVASITLTTGADIAQGDVIAIDYGTALQETKIVAGYNAGTKVVTLTSALAYTHTSGATVNEVTEDGSDIMLTDYRNLILGIQRNIRVETQRNARARTTSFVLTLRVDTQIENPSAIVVAEKLKVK